MQGKRKGRAQRTGRAFPMPGRGTVRARISGPCLLAIHLGTITGGKQANGRDGREMNTDEMAGMTVDGSALWRGQEVRVHVGGHSFGEGIVEDLTDDGSIVWIVFGGAEPRRMFLEEDSARYTVLPPTSIR